MTTADSSAEYSQRLAVRQQTAGILERRHFWVGNLRVAVLVALAVLVWRIARSGSPSGYSLVPGIVLFAALGTLHSRILRALDQARRAVRWYQWGQARIEDRWTAMGTTGEEFRQPDHVYAEGLDIFGRGSLFQLLSVARSRMGRENLSRWLLSLAGGLSVQPSAGRIKEIEERQAAVAELKPALDFREAIITAGEQEVIKADPASLKRWAADNVVLDYRRWWPWALLLAFLNVAALSYAVRSLVLTGSAFWTPFLLLLLVNGLVLYRLRTRMSTLLDGLHDANHNLIALAEVLRVIEGRQFQSPLLCSLQAHFFAGDLPASSCIAKLAGLSDLEDARHGGFVRLFDRPLLFSLQVALALNRWRARYSAHVAAWLDALGEFETLIGLATYAYEHSEDPFPQWAPPESPAMLQAESLGHPLLPAAQCVRNSVLLEGGSRLLLVSGSNMSGKSTLLRAIGVNTVLATIGAPVCARAMRLSPVSVGVSLHISDSLQKGVSHFYAEISRIRQVVDLSTRGPVLFLFDELLQGTNSHDRRVGAQGIVQALLRNGAIGLITTHDLALTALDGVFPGSITNVHFQEKLEAGKLSFDYQLRPGVVTTSNGLELMKSVGLDV
ncbi:MAG TPA: hypothetical protein VNW97_05985 [Candidatus Saccharimonadales bacterium]|jgi:hypothetical protein|nr:hypothetical protein [Candidatus Saccharimonadales bacterium]